MSRPDRGCGRTLRLRGTDSFSYDEASLMNLPRLLHFCSLLALLACAGGCKDRTEIQVYRAAKEGSTSGPAAHGEAAAPQAPVTWTVPEGWRQAPPSEMRYANFIVPGEDGESAEIAVSVFPGEGGDDLANVNRWRSQIGLEEIGAGELGSLIIPVRSRGGEMLMVDLPGEKSRVLAAWTRVGGRAWFFKLTAPERLAGREKDRFVGFLESVQFNP